MHAAGLVRKRAGRSILPESTDREKERGPTLARACQSTGWGDGGSAPQAAQPNRFQLEPDACSVREAGSESLHPFTRGTAIGCAGEGGG